MNRNLFYPTVLLLGLVSCRQRENVSLLKSVNRSLELSNTIIRDDCKLVYEAMLEKQKDPATAMSAQMWMPRVEKIFGHTDTILAKIESLKSILLKETDSLRVQSAQIIKGLSEPNGIGYDLLNRMAVFKDSVPAIFKANEFSTDITSLYTYLNQDIIRLSAMAPLLPGSADNLSKTGRAEYIQKWMEENLAGSSPVMAMVILKKLENEVLAIKKALTEFCLDHCNVIMFCGYNALAPIGYLNSSYVKQGQAIEVTAGIGIFNNHTKPHVTINGKEIGLDQNATAVYRFIANGKPGKHSIPIKIEFTKPDGSREIINKNCKYIIAE